MSAVAVHGLGYIGLPTAALLATNGYDVTGIDTEPDRIDAIKNGTAGADEPGLQSLVEDAIDAEQLRFRETAVPASYHFVCVPTPYDHVSNEPDLSYVSAATEGIAPVLREGDTVVIESTVPPGTTTGPVKTALESNALTAGEDFKLAYSPETVLPGSILSEFRQNDRLVGGIDDVSTSTVANVFGELTDGVIHQVPDPTSVEFAKLAQNSYRDANIALANEFAKIARDYGIRPRPALRLANTHPRVSIHRPGPGVGGHCLPVDPLYFEYDSPSVDLLNHARRINDEMISYIHDIVCDRLGSLDDRRIAIFGIAYKGNVDDTRNSPGERLAQHLLRRGQSKGETVDGVSSQSTNSRRKSVEITVHDPYVTENQFETVSRKDALHDADALIITTDHDEFATLNPDLVGEWMRTKFVLDTMGTIAVDEWTDRGFTVEEI